MKFSPMTMDEYDNAMFAAVSRKKLESGFPEMYAVTIPRAGTQNIRVCAYTPPVGSERTCSSTVQYAWEHGDTPVIPDNVRAVDL